MTDFQQNSSELYSSIKNESSFFGDMVFQHLNGGVEFGIRFIYQMVYAMKHYKFDYLLRIDDDYLFCMENFLHELPVPMEKSFHWGWVHQNKELTRPDEGLFMFSNDLITSFLRQNPKQMKCHPIGDQTVALWTLDLHLNKILHHDDRLHHHPTVRDKPSLRNVQNLCSKYMGIHGCYYEDMLLMWKNKGNFTKSSGTLKDHSTLILTPAKSFNWRLFTPPWLYEPKLCISNPKWDTKLLTVKGHYGGRENN